MTLARTGTGTGLFMGSVVRIALASRRLFASVSASASKIAPRVCDFGIETKIYHWALPIVGAL